MIIFKFTIEPRGRKVFFIKWIADQPIYLVHEPIVYQMSNGDTLTVPADFPSDGATVPWMLRWLFPQMGKYTRASVAHDYLYDNKIGLREQADREFLRWMIEDNVPVWKANLFYIAVRIGGKRWWTS